MSNIIILAATLLLFMAIPSYSAHDEHSHDNEKQIHKSTDIGNINVNENEVVIIVNGIVCSFCSQGVTRKLSKLPFIDQSKYKKGVKVEIENQKVTIAVKPDSEFDINEVFRSIKSGGYEPVMAYQIVENEVITFKPQE